MQDNSDLYTEALDIIRQQINRITYSNHLTQAERLDMLECLGIDLNRKLGWARATFALANNSEKNRTAVPD